MSVRSSTPLTAPLLQGPGTNSRHVISTNAITFEACDRVQARSYRQVFRETTFANPVVTSIGEYRDTFVPTPRWKLARREVVPG